ncbi:MAG: hypothetical protein EHM14_03540 [Methanothrix sp.]|nr:MAG: hypothetical protein EHM14_03540 [Methanothrix sp.]
MSSGVTLPIRAPLDGSVEGKITLNNGVTTPSVCGSGTLDPTYWIQDSSGKKALVHAEITAASYLWQAKISGTGYSLVSPVNNIGVIGDPTTYTMGSVSDVAAEQWIWASGISELHAYAQAWPDANVATQDRYAKVSMDITDSGGAGSISGTFSSPDNAITNAFYQKAIASVDSGRRQAYAEQSGTASGASVVSEGSSYATIEGVTQFYDVKTTVSGSTGHSIVTQAIALPSAVSSINLFQAKDQVIGTGSSVKIEESEDIGASEGTLKVTLNAASGSSFNYAPILSNHGSLIRDVVTTAKSGDSLIVDPGLYREQTITINKDLTISGSSTTNRPVVDGMNLNPLFFIDTGVHATINNLVIQKGLAPSYGGAITNQGTMVLTNCRLTNNLGATGGAIYNKGTATLDGVEIDHNSVSSNGFGGGIYNDATGSLTAILGTSTIHDNTAFHGGGIYNLGSITMTNAELYSNHASTTGTGSTGGRGGAIYNKGTATLTDVTVGESGKGNEARVGGGIDNEVGGTLSVTGGTISYNTAGSAGGLANFGTIPTISGTMFEYNTANAVNSQGGAIYSAGVMHLTDSTIQNNDAVFGAGIFNADTSGNSEVKNSLLQSNGNTGRLPTGLTTLEGGAISNQGPLGRITISDNEIYSNNAARGGGICNYGIATISNNYLAGNHATESGGALYNRAPTGKTGTEAILSGNTFGITKTSAILGNSADMYGGAIFNYGTGSKLTALLTATTNNVAYNTASIRGGAIYNNGNAASINGKNYNIHDNTLPQTFGY